MDYKTKIKNSLILPKTDFPMKANLPQREPQFLKIWEEEKIFEKIGEARKSGEKFILHDGPPFANGDAHLGHALNRTLKDIVIKSKTMAGYSVPFTPGWDCHGLPIEHKMMKEAKESSRDPLTIRKKCDDYARRYIDVQREQFKRLGAFGDWENPYVTIDPSYEAEILRGFAGLVEKGLVYQGLRPVHWSTGCRTALAEAEIEYATKEDLSVWVKFPLLAETLEKQGLPEGTSLLIWTTTPWTLPANLAVAVAPSLLYGVYDSPSGAFICMESLAETLPNFDSIKCLRGGIKGKELVGCEYTHPFIDRRGQVYEAGFVTAEAGTGLVHIAPGHGMDDYILGQANKLPTLSPVDYRGCLTEECGVPSLVGQYVFKANPLVRDILEERGLLWGEKLFSHDYPHCWRSKTPVIFRSVKQWFIRVEDIKEEALAEINKVKWIPDWGINRIMGAVKSRTDWCISRQRSWGVPIPVFYKEDEEAMLSGDVIRKFADIVETEGTNAWFEEDEAALAERLGVSKELQKGTDTLDVWIDSGMSWASVLKKQGIERADLYLEGSDQHRGWFQSSLLLSVALTGKAPYKSVLTNGFVVDVDGKKLSKSSSYKKPVDLMSLVNKYGADVLRLWVSSQNYQEDMPFSEEIFARVSDGYRSIRNTLRILLANLSGFNPDQEVLKFEKLKTIDREIYSQLLSFRKECLGAYQEFEFKKVYHEMNRFCSETLSSIYIDILKDRMYCDKADSEKRYSSQMVMWRVVETLAKLLAPIAPFTAEEVWEVLYQGKKGSVHLQLFDFDDDSPSETQLWEDFVKIRSEAQAKLEKMREKKEIGKSLQARLEIVLPEKFYESISKTLQETGETTEGFLAEFCIVSQVDIQKGEGMEVQVFPARGEKCVRCWKYDEKLGTHEEHPELCPRCSSILKD